MNKRFTLLEKFAAASLACCVAALLVGAAATATKYVGAFVGNGAGITNLPTAGVALTGPLSYLATNNATGLTNLPQAGVVLAGPVSRLATNDASTVTNAWGIPLTGMLTNNDSRVLIFKGGDMALSNTSTFFQMAATGGSSGYQYYDIYNGGSTLLIRRKADNGGSVLGTPLGFGAGDVATFGSNVLATGFAGQNASFTNLLATNATFYGGITNLSDTANQPVFTDANKAVRSIPVSTAQTSLGILKGVCITDADGTVTNTFNGSGFSVAPTVVATQYGALNTPTNWLTSVTTTNFVISCGAPGVTNMWIAIGTP